VDDQPRAGGADALADRSGIVGAVVDPDYVARTEPPEQRL
jgi:hypothetical protein